MRRVKPLDDYSYAVGICAAFCEVVCAGVKKISLSKPFTQEEFDDFLGEAFLEQCDEIAKDYNCKYYHLKEPVLTDLFPISENWGRQNIVFYREEKDIEELLAIQSEKNALQAAGAYVGEARLALAVRYGHLLSYSDEAIARYIRENNEKE